MANYPYTRDVPDGNNNPSVDRPDLTQNTNSIDSLIAEDHYGFGVDNGGFHKQVRMPALGSIPSGLIGSSGTNYVKIVNSGVGGNQAQLLYTNGTSGNEYQLTRADNTNFPTFGLFTGNTGWTFLPGAIRLQYGLTSESGSTTSVSFPINYTTVFCVYTVRIQAPTTLATVVSWGVQAITNSGFEFTRTSGAGNSSFYWMAMGI